MHQPCRPTHLPATTHLKEELLFTGPNLEASSEPDYLPQAVSYMCLNSCLLTNSSRSKDSFFPLLTHLNIH